MGLEKNAKDRPYDGKLRPKSWDDFDNKKTYWPTKEKFLKGIEKSRKYRMKEIVKEHLHTLSDEDKEEFKRALD